MANAITIKLVGGDQFVADAGAWLSNQRRLITSATRRRAQRIYARTYARYPIGPPRAPGKQGGIYGYKGGALRQGLVVKEVAGDNYQVMELVKNRAPHAHLYEWGTKSARTMKTAWGPGKGRIVKRTVYLPGIGFRRATWTNTGKMPAAQFGLVYFAKQERAALLADIRSILALPAPALGPGNPTVVNVPDIFMGRTSGLL